ncbi:MAG: FHA domain-containing protein [Actinomycetota bacterium]
MLATVDQITLEISGEAGMSQVPVRQATARIGRVVDNDVVIANELTVSRHHAELRFGDDGWHVVDLESRNGTHVNGERLDPGAAADVHVGDVLALGSVTLTVTATLDAADMTIDDPGGRDIHKLLTALSDRERDVLALVAAGHTDAQVGEELYISVKTVHSHLDRIRNKTGIRRRAELTRLAVRLGLTAGRA